jgi:hypothetical protein
MNYSDIYIKVILPIRLNIGTLKFRLLEVSKNVISGQGFFVLDRLKNLDCL